MSTTSAANDMNSSINALVEISNILETGLDRKTLTILLELIEIGVHPEALAEVVKQLRKEAANSKG